MELSNREREYVRLDEKEGETMKLNAGEIQKMLKEAETQETIYFAKCLVVVYKLKNGFCLVGVGACADPAEFDIEIGRQVAYGQVIDQLFKLEGYLLQNRLEAQTGV